MFLEDREKGAFGTNGLKVKFLFEETYLSDKKKALKKSKFQRQIQMLKEAGEVVGSHEQTINNYLSNRWQRKKAI